MIFAFRNLSRRTVFMFAAVTVAMILAGSSYLGPADANGPAPRQSAAHFEQRFMTQMIDHHGMAVEMGHICLEKATHDELRRMCQRIIDAQSEEIGMMQTWLHDWYGVGHEPMMAPKEQRQLDKLGGLSGPEFERRFMSMLIDHHQIATDRAQKCLEKAYHQELIDMCKDMFQAQTAEIMQLRSWLCDWYDVCRGHRGPDHGHGHRSQDGYKRH